MGGPVVCVGGGWRWFNFVPWLRELGSWAVWWSGGLHGAGRSFVCGCCGADGPVADGLGADLHLDVGDGVLLGRVNGFCCLGGMLLLVWGFSDAWRWGLACEGWAWVEGALRWV